MKNHSPTFTPKTLNAKALEEIFNRFKIQGLSILPVGRTAEVFRGLFDTTPCAQFLLAEPKESFKNWGFDNAFLLKTFDPVSNERGFDYFLSKDCFMYFSENTNHKNFISRVFSTWSFYPSNKTIPVPSVKENKLFMERNGMFQGEVADVMLAFQDCLDVGYNETDAPMFGQAQKLLNLPKGQKTKELADVFLKDFEKHPRFSMFKEILCEFL